MYPVTNMMKKEGLGKLVLRGEDQGQEGFKKLVLGGRGKIKGRRQRVKYIWMAWRRVAVQLRCCDVQVIRLASGIW